MRKIRFGPEFDGEYDRETSPRWQVQATKALPRIRPHEHTELHAHLPVVNFRPPTEGEPSKRRRAAGLLAER